MDGSVSIAGQVLAGLGLGGVLGAVVQRTGYCAMGAISDILLMADWRRMRSWLLAVAVAIAGTQGLALAGALDPAATAYAAPSAGLIGVIAGALLFGFGMTQTGGCLSKTLVRAGGGSLPAVLVLVAAALGAGATLVALSWSSGAPVPAPAGDNPLLKTGAGLLLAGGLLLFCLRDRRFATSALSIAGVILGALVPLGWLATASLGHGTGAAASLNFVGPMIPGSVLFWLALTLGTLAGAALAAWRAGQLRLERFSGAGGSGRLVAGGLLMGTGGMLAGGCTIGQGLSGVSTLALSSWLAVLGIVAGAVAGIRYLEEGTFRGAVRALFAPSG